MIYLNHTFDLLAGGHYKGNSSWNKRHSEVDNCFKLYYLTEGNAYISDKSDEYVLQNHKAYFINGNKLDRQYCPEHFSTHWLHFQPKDLLVYRGLLSLPTIIEIPGVTDVHLLNMFSDYELLTESETALWTKTLKGLELQNTLSSIVLNLLQTYSANLPDDTGKVSKIEPAIQYINENFKEAIRLKELAHLCFLSETYFHKTFKEVLNMTPATYQTRLKMNASIELLNRQDISIKQIADELGFTDAAHFCKSFKLYYGITPKEYQKQGKEALIL